MVAVAASFTVDQCLIVQLGCSWLAPIRVGPNVQPLQGENYTYSHILGHVQLLIQFHFHRLVLLIFYLPLVMNSFLGQLRCEEREFLHRLGGFGRCV
jgi:hypothetical protein